MRGIVVGCVGSLSVFQYGLCAIASRPAQNIHGSLFGVVHEKARQGCPKSRESVRGQTQIIKSAHVSTVCQPSLNKARTNAVVNGGSILKHINLAASAS
jgi:hypothetical protein